MEGILEKNGRFDSLIDAACESCFEEISMLSDLASGRMYTFLALNSNAEADLFPSSVFSSVAVSNNKILLVCFTQGQYADLFLARSRQSKDREDARTLCEVLDH